LQLYYALTERQVDMLQIRERITPGTRISEKGD